MPFNPTDELELRFTVAEWNSILAQLQEGKYKRMAPLISKINLQAAQLEHQQKVKEAAQQQEAAAPLGYTNGQMQPDVAVTGDSVGTIVIAKDG